MGIELHSATGIQKAFEREARLQPIAGEIIKDLNTNIQPVLNVNPIRVVNIVKRAAGATTSTATVYTTPMDRDFYLTSAFLSITKDAACANEFMHLDIIPKDQEVAEEILEINCQNTTEYTATAANTFSIPIILKRGSAITVVGGYAAGTARKTGIITGYTIDP